MACHRQWLLQAHQCQHGGRDIGESAIFHLRAFRCVDRDDGNIAQSVRGVRFAGVGIFHHLDIAMVGGQQHDAVRRFDRGPQAAQAFVDRNGTAFTAACMTPV